MFFWETLLMSVFQMFLDFDWKFLHVRKFYIIFLVQQKIIAIKDAIPHL